MKNHVTIIITAIALILCSCNKEDGKVVEYVPFQETDGGQWGMISPSGEVLYTEEFKNAPTLAIEGRFMVKNEKGLWEIYTAEKKPQKVGNEYAYATSFHNGRALVSERNDYIKIIDTDGKEIKKLDKIGNKLIDAVGAFSEGYSVYQTGNVYGTINENGKEIIKPDYLVLYPCSDGKFIGVNKKHEKEFNKKEGKRKLIYDVLDKDGKILFSINTEKYSNIGTRFIDGLLPVAMEKDGKECWGLLNDKNEIVIKPSEKIKGISDIKDDRFVYTNGEGYGVMNLEGKNIIRAKYDFLYFDVTNRLVAITEKTKDSKNYECKFIDDGDNQIGEEKFVSINPFSQFDGNYSFVKISDRIWSVINKEGKQVEGLPDIVNINLSIGDYEVMNDHIDFPKFFDEINLSATTIDSITIGKTTPIQAVKYYSECFPDLGTKDHPVMDPYWYDYKSSLVYYKSFSNIFVDINVSFPQNISRRTYRNEKIKYWEDEDYNYYFNRKIPTGYSFNNTKVHSLAVAFTNSGRLNGKLELLLKELKARFKKYGKVEKENSGAAVFTISNTNRATMYLKDDTVYLIWGDIKSVDKLDIEEYKDTKEKIRIDDSIIQTVNGKGFPINFGSPTVDTDSVEVVDSVAVVE